VHGDEGHAGFDEPPGQQGSLSDRVAAVAFPQSRVLAVDVECPLGRRAGDQVERVAVEPVDAVHQAAGVDVAADPVESRQQLPAVADPAAIDASGQRQVADLEVLRVRVGPGVERVRGHAQEGAALVTRSQADRRGVGNRHERRETPAVGAADLRGDRADRRIHRVLVRCGRTVVASPHPVCRGEVVAVVVVDAANQAHPISQPGLFREHLAQLHAGNRGVDRVERSLVLLGSLRLRIVGVDVRRPAV